MLQILFLSLIITTDVMSQDTEIKKDSFFNHLTNEEAIIIINKGTERPFSGKYNNHFDIGTYICKACNNPLFHSAAKFKSNCGWPSFDEEIKGAIIRSKDHSYGMNRVEISCSNCKGHLGHVFQGENYTKRNTRHCVNSLSLKFVPR